MTVRPRGQRASSHRTAGSQRTAGSYTATLLVTAVTLVMRATLRAAGNACYEVELAGTGRTTWLAPGGTWWSNELGPFIWGQLHLATAAK